MATRVIDDTKLQNIAVAIQGKDSGGTMTVDEMPTRIAAIQTGDEVLFSTYGRQYTRTVVIPDGVTILGNYAFDHCTGLTNITLPDSLATIDQYVFNGCTGLTEIDCRNAASIGNSAFRDCSALQEIDCQNAASIGSDAFFSCSSLQEIDCRNATSIGASAFNRCSSLQEIDLRNVGAIGVSAFQNCSSLRLIDLTSRTNPTTLNNINAFNNTNSTWIAVVADDTIKTAFQNATNWSAFASHFRTIAEVGAEVGMTYDEYYLQIFGHARNEVSA